MDFDSSREEVKWFVEESDLAQPLLTAVQMGYGFRDVASANDLTSDQLFFLHATWVERQRLLRPEIDPNRSGGHGGGHHQSMGGAGPSGPDIPPHLR